MIKIGLLGCGNVGHIIAAHAGGIQITAVYDIIPERAEELAALCALAHIPIRGLHAR